jgi:hypothetical protein
MMGCFWKSTKRIPVSVCRARLPKPKANPLIDFSKTPSRQPFNWTLAGNSLLIFEKCLTPLYNDNRTFKSEISLDALWTLTAYFCYQIPALAHQW